jgi:hypothetical protein
VTRESPPGLLRPIHKESMKSPFSPSWNFFQADFYIVHQPCMNPLKFIIQVYIIFITDRTWICVNSLIMLSAKEDHHYSPSWPWTTSATTYSNVQTFKPRNSHYWLMYPRSPRPLLQSSSPFLPLWIRDRSDMWGPAQVWYPSPLPFPP